MKINPPSSPADPSLITRTGTEAVQSQAKPEAAGRKHAAGTTQVQLSSTATDLRAEGSTPEFNAEKVAQVKQSIADGSYKVNPEVIADKLIANAQEVLSAGKR